MAEQETYSSTDSYSQSTGTAQYTSWNVTASPTLITSSTTFPSSVSPWPPYPYHSQWFSQFGNLYPVSSVTDNHFHQLIAQPLTSPTSAVESFTQPQRSPALAFQPLTYD